MKESGPVRKTYKDLERAMEFTDLVSLGPNVFRGVSDGKYWLLKTAKANDTSSLQLLRREYEISRNLQHPFILSSFRFLEDSPAGPAIMMEYVEGKTLGDFLSGKPSASTRRKILSQILSATEYLHQKGLLHNDLKPSNILISSIGEDAKLIDFGYAENDADFLARKLGGTDGYTAPEVLQGNLSIFSDASSDIYSLGSIIKALFPKRYSAIVRKCLSVSPQKRYRDIASLRTAISRYNERPWIIATAVVLLLVILGASTPSFINRNNSSGFDGDSLKAELSRFHQEVIEVSHAAQTASVKQEKEASKEIKDSVRLRIDKIRKDYKALFQKSLDSINDKEKYPFWEFASTIYDNFQRKAYYYKQSFTDDWKYVCDTISNPMLSNLLSILNSRPFLISAREQGMISQEEYSFYYDSLYRKGRAFTPYRKP